MLQKDVAQGIHRVEDAYVNWYLVEDGNELTIVDAGVPSSWDSLTEALAGLGRSTKDVKALVLTHAHFDHLGIAERARTPYFLTKFRAFPIVAALLANRAWWPERISEVRRFENGSLDVPSSPRVIPTPGHTLGHCALHFPERDTVIAGDAVVTLNPYTGGHGPQIVSGAATADSKRALDSLDALAGTGAATVLTGHGDPWSGGAAEAVRLARAAGPS